MYNALMKQQLEIIQKQKQKFSSKLVPSMEILTLSQHDLEEMVDTSLMENPFSDVEKEGDIETREVDFDDPRIRKKQGDVQEFDIADETLDDLSDHVLPQLYPYIKNKKDEEVFTVLLESLDSRGFLAETKEELCRFLKIKPRRFEEYLHILQHVDPLGLGAKDYWECLLIQLREMPDTQLAQALIQTHLEDIRIANLAKIAREEQVAIPAVKQALALIQTLHPIPANGFRVREKTIYIVPDVYIRKQDQEITIEMNAKIQEKLNMNVNTYELYKTNAFDEAAKQFMKEKLNDFKWLQYSVSRRMVTLKKIILFLVDYQMAYFQSGDERLLRPLRLTDIASQLGIHSSTISRAIANKFFQCAYGTYPFHYLMPRCYEKQGEVVASIDTIKNEIKEIIKAEDKAHPYSDEKIHQLLGEEGFLISRRSVTLYRKECDIPSSLNRKHMYEE